jgi:senataxin
MHPDICRFPSEHFYHRRLTTDPSVAIRMKYFSLQPLYLYNITHSPHRCDGANSSCNEGEAAIVRDFCHKLIAHLVLESSGVSQDNNAIGNIHGEVQGAQSLQSLPFNDPRSIEAQQRIAVITPYKAQVRVLRSYLPSYIEIMTADGSQGKEKDIVIISCVRSGGNIGFLNDKNRLNVMLTRSKNALYVFGNLTQLASQHRSWEAFVNHAHVNRVISNVDEDPFNLPYRVE